MKKSEFIALLESPEELGNQHIVGLQEAVKEFPYFQSAQLLLTKAFHKTENINFEGQLKKTAAFASDRKRLHQLIFDQEGKQEGFIKNDVVPTEKVSHPAETTQDQTEEEQVAWQEPITPKNVEKETPKPSFIPDFGLVAEENEEQKEELDDQLQKQVLTEAIHQSILMEVDDQLPDFNEKSEAEETGHQTPSEEDSTLSKFNEATALSKFNEATAHSFSDWLNFYKEENESTDTSFLWDNTSEESKEAIASFRPESPNLPARQEFYSAAKMAKLSVQEDDDLVTETLANIYAEQDNPEKAIKAFEKLQLKYPEKKVYFAGRIKEIENQLNS